MARQSVDGHTPGTGEARLAAAIEASRRPLAVIYRLLRDPRTPAEARAVLEQTVMRYLINTAPAVTA